MARIVTLTVNPALDVTTATQTLAPARKLRCEVPRLDPGGGGINVARTVVRLGGEACAFYASGGPIGALLGQLLDEESVPWQAIEVPALTRLDFAVVAQDSGDQYRFVLPGPNLERMDPDALIEPVAEASADAEWVVASGSLAPGLPEDFYARLTRAVHAQGNGTRVAVDTSGAALRCTVRLAGADLIKPNRRELAELTDRPVEDRDAAVEAARQLIEDGRVQTVAVSLGHRGALLVDAEEAEFVPAPDIEVRSTIGAGDTFLGGLLVALSRGEDRAAALRTAVAAATATLTREGTQLCRPEDVDRIKRQLA